MAALHTPEFWVAIGFILLVLAIAKKSWAAIKAGLDSRAERIRVRLDDATKLREEAQHLPGPRRGDEQPALQVRDDGVLVGALLEAQENGV